MLGNDNNDANDAVDTLWSCSKNFGKSLCHRLDGLLRQSTLTSRKKNQQGKPQFQAVQQVKRNPNFDYNKSQQPPLQKNANERPEPMEVENSARFKQTVNWHQHNKPLNGQKRKFESSRQNIQHPNKMQRINQLKDENPPEEEAEAADEIL